MCPGLSIEKRAPGPLSLHKVVWSYRADGLIAAGAYPGFCSMGRLGMFLLLLDGMVVQLQVTPLKFVRFPNNSLVPLPRKGNIAGPFLYTDGCLETIPLRNRENNILLDFFLRMHIARATPNWGRVRRLKKPLSLAESINSAAHADALVSKVTTFTS